jgi:hypothetical protein
MWLAKSSEEMAQVKRCRRLTTLIVAMVVWVALLGIIALPSFLAERSAGKWVLPVHGIIPRALLNIATFGLVLGAVYWLRRSHANSLGPLICQKCNRVKVNDGQTACGCGGKYLSLDAMKWVDEGKPPSNATTTSASPLSLSVDS